MGAKSGMGSNEPAIIIKRFRHYAFIPLYPSTAEALAKAGALCSVPLRPCALSIVVLEAAGSSSHTWI